MKQKLILALLALALVAGCKKKAADDNAAGKPTEGSAALAGSAAAPAPAPAPNAPGEPAKADPAATKNLLDTAKQAGTFTTFLKAVDAAGITENLNGAGPFTVFAPTDDAFAKLPPKELEALLADKAKLAQVLQYHVVAGAITAKDLATQKSEKSIQGGDLVVDASAGVKIGGSTVVKPDLVASNGVIHGIDTVLLPPAK